ncbi:MAG: hypothetical protein AAF770_03515 [Bacteroidota bacterium]
MAITRLKRKNKRNKLKSTFRKNYLKHLGEKIIKKKEVAMNTITV